jgi:hypothetical protein
MQQWVILSVIAIVATIGGVMWAQQPPHSKRLPSQRVLIGPQTTTGSPVPRTSVPAVV